MFDFPREVNNKGKPLLQQMFKKGESKEIDYLEEKLSDGGIKKYIKGRLLGKGGFAKCFEVTSTETEIKYAAKAIDKNALDKAKGKEKLGSEIKIHRSLSHQYIVGFDHVFEDDEFVYILLQKCPNQTLNQLLKRRKKLTDIETKYYMHQLVIAVKYLHAECIIHRDLKLGNLFLSDKLELKIGDFGLATKINYAGERKKTKCGTPNYIAPQILDDKKSHSYEVDIWSLGVIAYTLLIGKPPFETNDVKATYAKIKACQYEFPECSHLSDQAKKFISKMLQLDPSKRPTLDEILDDPFLYSESIPSFLPIASLACPPSQDFLKKYRNIEPTHLKSSIKQQPLLNSGQYTKHSKQKSLKSKSNKNLNSKINTIERSLASNNRVLSSANLLSQNLKVKQFKEQKDLMQRSEKIWVCYWQDHPSYGLGYLFNSNVSGFRFNDSTCLIGGSKNKKFKFIEYDFINRKFRDQDAQIWNRDQLKKNEEKKYKIFTHFDHQLRNGKKNMMKNQAKSTAENKKNRQSQQNFLTIYIRRYHRTVKALILWYSNSTIQIIFEDNTELIVNQAGIITYANKAGQRYSFIQSEKQKQVHEIKKRLSYLYGVVKSLKSTSTKESVVKNSAQISRCNSAEKLQEVEDQICLTDQQLSSKLTLRRDFDNKK